MYSGYLKKMLGSNEHSVWGLWYQGYLTRCSSESTTTLCLGPVVSSLLDETQNESTTCLGPVVSRLLSETQDETTACLGPVVSRLTDEA